MAAHASDWGDSLNRRRKGGKRNTMVMMFGGGVVLMFDGFFVLFLPYDIYGAGVVHSRPNPYGLILTATIPMDMNMTFHFLIRGCIDNKI